LGFDLNPDELEKAFTRFKKLADMKKEIFDEDLETIVQDEISSIPETFKLIYVQTTSGSQTVPTATVKMERDNEIFEDAAIGDGPVDASYQAIDRITKMPGKLISYGIRSVTGGKDALGDVVVKVDFNGEVVIGSGASTDIIEASAKAYLNAVNKIAYRKKK